MTKTRIAGVAVAGWCRRLIAGSADRGLAVVVAALVAALAAPVAAQDDDYALAQLTPAYTQGPFFVVVSAGAEDDCAPSGASMERIIEGELLRAGLETGPNEHAVAIGVSTAVESSRGCTVVVRTNIGGVALSPDGCEIEADLLLAVVAELARLRERCAALEHENRRLAAAVEEARAEGERVERERTVRTMGRRLPSILIGDRR